MALDAQDRADIKNSTSSTGPRGPTGPNGEPRTNSNGQTGANTSTGTTSGNWNGGGGNSSTGARGPTGPNGEARTNYNESKGGNTSTSRNESKGGNTSTGGTTSAGGKTDRETASNGGTTSAPGKGDKEASKGSSVAGIAPGASAAAAKANATQKVAGGKSSLPPGANPGGFYAAPGGSAPVQVKAPVSTASLKGDLPISSAQAAHPVMETPVGAGMMVAHPAILEGLMRALGFGSGAPAQMGQLQEATDAGRLNNDVQSVLDALDQSPAYPGSVAGALAGAPPPNNSIMSAGMLGPDLLGNIDQSYKAPKVVGRVSDEQVQPGALRPGEQVTMVDPSMLGGPGTVRYGDYGVPPGSKGPAGIDLRGPQPAGSPVNTLAGLFAGDTMGQQSPKMQNTQSPFNSLYGGETTPPQSPAGINPMQGEPGVRRQPDMGEKIAGGVVDAITPGFIKGGAKILGIDTPGTWVRNKLMDWADQPGLTDEQRQQRQAVADQRDARRMGEKNSAAEAILLATLLGQTGKAPAATPSPTTGTSGGMNDQLRLILSTFV